MWFYHCAPHGHHVPTLSARPWPLGHNVPRPWACPQHTLCHMGTMFPHLVHVRGLMATTCLGRGHVPSPLCAPLAPCSNIPVNLHGQYIGDFTIVCPMGTMFQHLVHVRGPVATTCLGRVHVPSTLRAPWAPCSHTWCTSEAPWPQCA
jgi:hypothetical protein